jgi:hypothetical protein
LAAVSRDIFLAIWLQGVCRRRLLAWDESFFRKDIIELLQSLSARLYTVSDGVIRSKNSLDLPLVGKRK